MFDNAKANAALTAFQSLLDATPGRIAHVRPGPEAWTLTEIVGHLIDSAGNNHQRFVRLQTGNLAGFPAYEAEPWVAVQRYDAFDFSTIKTLWSSFNALLLHLACNTPESAMGHVWSIGDKNHTLEFLLNDYYDHLSLHVDHYRTRLAEVRKAEGLD